MKRNLLFLALFFCSFNLLSQVNHEVSGIVKDSTDNTVIGASVTLMSAKDTLRTSTNPDGIFVFKNVQAGQFVISVRSLGYMNFTKRFLYNDATKRLVLDPLILKAQTNMLNEVKIDGTPSITYKEDTIEYRASDYKVRENATVDEILKKMEGVEVGSDGTVTAQGTQVTKARLNGKDFSGGDVANAIQNLPAEIVDKIQIVDDYGDQAARTGIKEGDPQKVLNIVTRRDRSVGNMGRLNAGAGNNERYGVSVFGNRINGNQQINTNLRFNNTVNGVAGGNNDNSFSGGGDSRGGRGGGGGGGGFSGSAGGSGGTTTLGRGSFGYRDQWGKKVSFNGSYSYGFNNVNSLNSSVSETNTGLEEDRKVIYSANESEADNNRKNHAFDFDLEYDIDSANFLRIRPSVTYTTSLASSFSTNIQTGLYNQTHIGGNRSENTTPNFGGSLFYQHLFKKKGRNFSLNLSYTQSDQDRDNEQNVNILYYNDEQPDVLVKDSLVHRMVLRKNLNNTFRGSTTFSERLGTKSRLDFNAQINRRSYDNSAYTNNLDASGIQTPVDSLTNVFNYSFTESRFSLNYRFTEKKYNFSLGMTGIPTLLEGTKVHLDATTRRSNFYLIPIARFEYQFSRQHRFSLNYTGNASEPSFDQIQPVRDVSRANNPVVGNPDLKAAFNHTVSAAYNNYISNSRLNYSLNLNARFVDNSVVSNVVNIPVEIKQDGETVINYINETRFLNMNGASTLTGNYSVSKSLADRKYSIRLNGSVVNRKTISMSNNLENRGTTWTFSQRLGPQINPNEWLELNPHVNFVYTKADFTLPGARDINTKNWALSGDARIYFTKTILFSFNASKNFVSGIDANVTNNPFIINSALEKQFFKRKNGALSIQAFDLLNQNNFINRDINENGYTDTRSNALSRYVMLNFRWTPQKWTGAAASRNGRTLNRRGDGSFY